MKTTTAAATPGINLPRYSIGLLWIFVILSILPGCVGLRGLRVGRQPDPLAGAPRLRSENNPPLDEVVAHLNKNTERIQSWRANKVDIRAKNLPRLSGMLVVEKGRHLRLVVNSLRGSEVDLGSNDERFWVWSRSLDPAYVTCKHENLESARQQMGIPFEPDWLMQALGVSMLPTTGIKMESAPDRDQARLVEQIVSAHGQPLRRVILVDLKRGVVIEHSLYDYNSHPIAFAKLSEHALDKATGAVIPHCVHLDWPQNQLSMTMHLGDVQVNPRSIPSQIWAMPEMKGCEVVNLDAGIRRGLATARVESPIQLGDIETVRSHDDHNFLRDSDSGQESEGVGHAQLLNSTNDSSFEEDESDWDK